MDGKIIKLQRPADVFGKQITEIELKEPTGALFARLGPPRLPVFNQAAGSGYFVPREDITNEYLDKLVHVPGQGAEAITIVRAQLSLADAICLREALFSFFADAEQKAAEMR